MDFEISSSSSLPSSTGGIRSIIVDQMERQYVDIAVLINNLVINDNIIKCIQDLVVLERANGDSWLLGAYEQKITDL